ncbi:MAG: tRNA-dihydrouridine synthase [Candidatus Absconditicoccaceae bacterium]
MILGLAPMDGFTDCAMRHITQNIFDKYGNKSDYDFLLWTEFMTADGYDRNPGGVIKHLLTSPKQENLIAQIFGGKQETLVKTAIDIENRYGKYFKGIELNIGCPANNVMKSGGGSELLRDKKNTLKIIKTLQSDLNIPFSIKTRTGLNQEDKNNQTEFILQASNYCSSITIHGRTLAGGYHELPDRDFIYNIKKLANKDCKIIGNGGIKSYSELKDYYKHNETILDGLLIGQSAIGNPRIFTPHTPDIKELKETVLQHLNLMIDYEIQFQKNIQNSGDIKILLKNNKLVDTQIPQPRLIVEFRKHLFNYVKGIPGSKEFKQKIAQIKDYENLVNEINNFLID